MQTSWVGISQDPIKKTETILCLSTKGHLPQVVNYIGVLGVYGLMH